MIVLWGRDTSLNVQKPMWAMYELGVEFKRIDAGGAYGKLDTAEYGAMNPNRRVPTLIDGELVMWESNACTRYIAARYGAGILWPEDPAARAHADMWMDWQQTMYLPAFQPVFNELVRVPRAKRDMDMVAAKAKECGALMGMLDAWLEGRDYIAGDALCMGDIPVGASLYRYFDLPIERPSLPRVAAYYARLQARQAYRDSAMISYEPLKVEP